FARSWLCRQSVSALSAPDATTRGASDPSTTERVCQMTISWPNGARIAVCFTFDFDAESVWLAREPENAERLGVLSQGLYGAKRAVPKLLELLAAERMPATFFVPGWVAEHHTDRCKEILDAGHEIGHHGYSHEWADPRHPERECEDFDRGTEALARFLN